MEIVFLTHPDFFTSLSMPRYAKMLSDSMSKRGHKVEVWSAAAKLSLLAMPAPITKWLKYVDQYLVFPYYLNKRIKSRPQNTLFVFTDIALGMWVSHIANRPHVIHCHDFLAQRCAIGEVPGSAPGWTGKKYQEYIRRGYNKGRNFISVSDKTRNELHRFLNTAPHLSEVVYNGLNKLFKPSDPTTARHTLSEKTGLTLTEGFLLHIGGNQWYKNRKGVVDIYDAWRLKNTSPLQLLMIGQAPSPDLLKKVGQSPFKKDIHLLTGMDDALVSLAYAGASLFIFPSLAEGFGWPIVEAMASGCLVITTNEAPMTEVAGDAGFLIPVRPFNKEDVDEWSSKAADTVESVLKLSPTQKKIAVDAGFKNAARFDIEKSMDNIERVYKKIVETV